LRVRDVADVGIGKAVRTGASTYNGEECVLGSALMLAGENSRLVAKAVAAKLKELQPKLPAGVQIIPVYDRTVLVDGAERPYMELLWWTVLIGGVYLPATVIPVGTSADGLPIGVQIVGPYMEDRTALAVARAIRNELGPMQFPG
jgi:hypothetical protein